MLAVRNVLRPLRDQWKRRWKLISITYLPAWTYYGSPWSSFSREHRAVAEGIAQNLRLDRGPGARHTLRRQIHMLEKGLSMRPLRQTFGEAYIGETVTRLSAGIAHESLSAEDISWSRDVLVTYFDATAGSPSAVIADARRRYELIAPSPTSSQFRGPIPRGSTVSPVSIADLRMLAENRQSVRWFEERKVPELAVEAALDVAMQSPTACNRVPYRFLVYLDPRDAADVARLAMGTAGYSENIPALAIVVGDLSAYTEERDRHLIYIDGSLAAMSFLLALEAQGLSSCCINWPDIPSRERAMAERLGLPKHERVVMLIAIGFADPAGTVPGSGKVSADQYRRFS